jgi:hypothetical protein
MWVIEQPPNIATNGMYSLALTKKWKNKRIGYALFASVALTYTYN